MANRYNKKATDSFHILMQIHQRLQNKFFTYNGLKERLANPQ